MQVDQDSSRPAGSVRVALVGCTGLLGEIILNAVSGEEGFEVVLDLDAAPAADDAPWLEALDVDLVLWNDADESRVARWMGVASSRCVPRMLATFGDGRGASLWQLVPQRRALGEPSAATLVDAIRASAGALAEPS